ncbi:MAG: SsrA-binding protein SmpB [Myxococcales bacterium]|nr:SsrA-binding protein SmpB [Myxococcales bacterium]
MGAKKKNRGAPAPGQDGYSFARNRRALHEYHVLERFEAGLSLFGSEVKSIRAGRTSLVEAYCQFVRDELYLMNAHIAEYTQAHSRNHVPLRQRKLLLHRRELERLQEAVGPGGLTIIPLSLYAKGGKIKLEIGLCRGKKLHDKRATIKEREQKREMQRAVREQRDDG